MKKAGYILLLLGFGVELVMLILMIILLLFGPQMSASAQGNLIISIMITVVILVLEVVAIYLSKESKGWLICLLVISIIAGLMSILDGKIPLAPVIFVIGSLLMLSDFNSAMKKRI